ncbi:amidohydrolase family protein [Rhodococcus wratislaviensis]|uniref:metal-dependent hydrolase family protein n=1 Tax=Rhodococcus wratislaviensis TaxID=44752 RepID=UPI003515E576
MTEQKSRLLITNAHLLHPERSELTEESWIEAVDGRITASGSGHPPSSSCDNVRVLDAAGSTVMPGLIDAHVHILLTTIDFTEFHSWSASYTAVRALREAGRMLRRGFTTIRDVGGADYGMAKVLDEQLMAGPRLIFGGSALSQTGGHGDLRSLSDRSVSCCGNGVHFTRIADGVAAVRAAARDEFRKGAHHLKIMASGGVASPHDEISAVQYSDEELRAAVEEADNHNRYVTVHAYHPRAINRALNAGVRCVEHGNLVDDETIKLLVEKDAFLVPTLVTYEQLALQGRQSGLSESSCRKIDDVRFAGLDGLERAHKAGVNLVYGSDLLGSMHPHQLNEFALRAQVQPNVDIIRSATTTAARLLRMEGQIGTLSIGAHADMLILRGDPLQDISVLTSPEKQLRYVIRAGLPIEVAE